MAILGIGSGTSPYLDQSVLALKNQLTVLQSQITSGEKSTTYAGMGVNEGFAIAARSQLASISGYSDAMTNINTNIGVANTTLQSLVDIGTTVQNSASGSSTALNSSGQSIGQQTAAAQLASMLGILNTQSGNNYLFSGSAINTPSVASYDAIINGTTTQAGLKQVIAERLQADTGALTGVNGTMLNNGLSGAVISSTGSTMQVAPNSAGSLFAFTLSNISTTGTAATASGPRGTPAALSVTFSTQPNPGDQVNVSFNLPDGTPEQIQLTATTTNPAPAGSFLIDPGSPPIPPSTAVTASNLSTALTNAIGALPVSLGRVAITSPNSSSLQVSGDSSPFGLKLGAISATGSAVATTGPTGSPAVGSVTLSPQSETGSPVLDQFSNPITTSTPLSAIGFTAGEALHVNGTSYLFVNTGSPATGTNGVNIDISDTVGTLLTKIDATAGTTSSISTNGAITLNLQDQSNVNITTNNPATFASLGFPPSSVTLARPVPGDQVNFTFKLPDGTTQQISMTATTTTPPPAGSYLIGSTTAATTSNLKSALAASVWNLANTQLVASSAIEAGNDFFSAGTATGSAAGSSIGSDSLSAVGFAANDTLTVNGTTLTFGTGANQVNPATTTVSNLLTEIDSITGTSTPSTISATGAITLHTDDAPDLNITSSNPTALAALGFGPTISGTLAPLRVSGPPYNTATQLVSGTPSNTVSWYTGNQAPTGSARASQSAQVDNSVTVQYGIQADEQAIRSQLQNIAVLSTVTTSPTNPIATQVVSALSQGVAQNLTTQPGQQSIENIQSDLATAQVTMQDAQARQTQSQTTLQNLIDQTETVSTDQVASEILALQTSLQASYQTTSMLSQLTLTKYLPVG